MRCKIKTLIQLLAEDYMFLGIVLVLDMTHELYSILGRIQREECDFLELYPDSGKENIVNQVVMLSIP